VFSKAQNIAHLILSAEEGKLVARRASLNEVFEELEIDAEMDFLAADTLDPKGSKKGVASKSFTLDTGNVTKYIVGENTSSEFYVRATGRLKNTTKLVLKASYGLQKKDRYFKVWTTNNFDSSLKLRVGATKSINKDGKKINLKSWTKYFSFGVVSGAIDFDLVAGYKNVKSTGKAWVESGLEFDHYVKSGVQWTAKNKWSTIRDKKKEWKTSVDWKATASAKIEAKTYIALEGALLLWGVAGPQIDIEAYARAEAEGKCANFPQCSKYEACVSLYTGVDLNLRLVVDLFGLLELAASDPLWTYDIVKEAKLSLLLPCQEDKIFN
jgi:hypothetical protein